MPRNSKYLKMTFRASLDGFPSTPKADRNFDRIAKFRGNVRSFQFQLFFSWPNCDACNKSSKLYLWPKWFSNISKEFKEFQFARNFFKRCYSVWLSFIRYEWLVLMLKIIHYIDNEWMLQSDRKHNYDRAWILFSCLLFFFPSGLELWAINSNETVSLNLISSWWWDAQWHRYTVSFPFFCYVLSFLFGWKEQWAKINSLNLLPKMKCEA